MPNKIQQINSSVTVLIYVSNDEKNIGRAVESSKLLTQNIVAVDIGSTDNTADLAKKSGAQILSLRQESYVELVRMKGIEHVKTDWVFILDSDEVVTAELANEVNRVLGSELEATSYRIPRRNIFGQSKWLRHGGWWPDLQTRLINKSSIVEWPSAIHSTPKIKGTSMDLKEPLIHYSHGDFSQMVKKTIKFEGVESDLLHKAVKRASIFTFFRKFLGELYRRLIKQKGFLDGKEGFAESIYQAYSKTVTYLMLYEKSR